MNYLISQYPLTRTYLERLSEITGEANDPIVVSTISSRGYWSIISQFRKIESDTLFIPVLDSSSKPLLAPLQILSMFVRARRRKIIDSDFSIRDFGLKEAVFGGLRMVLGAADGALTVFFDWVRLGRLLKAERFPVCEIEKDQVFYLKTNLWLGVQAGGSVAHTSGVIRGFLNQGCFVEFMSAEKPVALPKSDRLKISPVTPQSTYVIPREFNHYRHNKLFLDSAVSQLDANRGFIYQRLSLGNYAGVMSSRRNRLPLVIEYNGSENWLANNWGTPLSFKELAMRAENACLRHAHLLVTVSDVLRDELIERGVEPQRIVSFPNGVDTEMFDPEHYSKKETGALREHLGIAKDALVVTFVGTFGPWHGAEVLAQTVVEMATENPSFLLEHKIHFMFIGDGVRRRQVENLIDTPEVRRHVTITGLVEQTDTPLYLAASDILLSPHVRNPDGSPFFGSPTKLFEYLSSGRPVIASDLEQIGEILEGCPGIGDLEKMDEENVADHQCGFLIEPESTNDLSKAIQCLAENRHWREEMGRNARRLAVERYSWGHHVAAIFDGLERVKTLDSASIRPPVRILFNGLHSKSGGGLTYLQNILPVMARDRNIDLHVCVHEDQREFLPDNMENITLHTLEFPQGFWRLQWYEQIKIPRLARDIGADATFSPANYGPLMAPNSVLLLRNALSVAFVERRLIKLGYWSLVYLGTFLSLLMSKRAITVSNYARRSASGGLIGLLGGRFSVIPHGVSKIFTPGEGESKRDFFLLAVSDLYVQKNFKNLFSAFARLSPEHPDLILKIAGRPVDLGYFQELKEMITRMKIDGKVEFLGGVSPSNLVDLYRRCIVFVFPSTIETFGNPLVEAMACGAPIASSNTAAMPEVVKDAAVYFNPEDVEDMSSVLNSLLKDNDLRHELSRKATERSKAFSWEKTAQRTLQVIKAIPLNGDRI